MVNRFVIAAAVAVSMAASATLPACDSLVGLGPEATLREAGSAHPGLEAGVVGEASTPESSMPEAEAPESGLSCGLMPAANKVCDTCSNVHCCDISVECGKHPRCAEGLAKLLDCVFDATCVEQIDTEYADAGVVDLQTCVLMYCVKDCFPGKICSQLAACCKDIPPSAARDVCIGTVNLLDESNCTSILDNTLRPQLGSQFCGGPAPVDAGHD